MRIEHDWRRKQPKRWIELNYQFLLNRRPVTPLLA